MVCKLLNHSELIAKCKHVWMWQKYFVVLDQRVGQCNIYFPCNNQTVVSGKSPSRMLSHNIPAHLMYTCVASNICIYTTCSLTEHFMAHFVDKVVHSDLKGDNFLRWQKWHIETFFNGGWGGVVCVAFFWAWRSQGGAVILALLLGLLPGQVNKKARKRLGAGFRQVITVVVVVVVFWGKEIFRSLERHFKEPDLDK